MHRGCGGAEAHTPDRAEILRARLGVAIVLLFTVLAGVRGVRDLDTGAASVTSYGAITGQFARQYEALRPRLPERGTIGFVSDGADDLAYVLAHYHFVPLIVKHWPQERVVVGHFGSEEAARRFLERSDPRFPAPPDAELHAIVVPR